MKDERVKEIYAELNRYEIELASDPVSLGPKYLQELIATCRNYMSAITKLLMEVNLEKQMVMRELNSLQTVYDVEADDLLTNDERVRRGSNIKDREAIIKTLLRDQLRAIATKKAEVNDLTCIEKAVKHKHQEMKDTMDAIKMQKSLINAEISTGAMYGDERASSGHGHRSSPVLTPPEMLEEDEVLALLGDAGSTPPRLGPTPAVETRPSETPAVETRPSDFSETPHAPGVVELTAAPSAADMGMDDDVTRFLGGIPQEDDFSSLLP